MPARTGEQYVQRLKDRPPALYLRGEKVKDATTHPGLTGGIWTVAQLYDLQHDPKVGSEMTYASPTTGDAVGLSFITPRTTEDLLARHRMMTHWAKVSCGMMGRTPDFLNASLMAMAAAGDYFGEDRPEFKKKHTELLRVRAGKRPGAYTYAGQPATQPPPAGRSLGRPDRHCPVGGRGD